MNNNDKITTKKQLNSKVVIIFLIIIILILVLFFLMSLIKIKINNEELTPRVGLECEQITEISNTIINKTSQQITETCENYSELKDGLCEDLYYDNYTKALETLKTMDAESINFCKSYIEDVITNNLISYNILIYEADEIDYKIFEDITAITDIIDFSDTYKGRNIIKYTEDVLKMRDYSDTSLFMKTSKLSEVSTFDFYVQADIEYMLAGDWDFYSSLSQSALKKMKTSLAIIKPYNSSDSEKLVEIMNNQYNYLMDMYNALCNYDKDSYTIARDNFNIELNKRKELLKKYIDLQNELLTIIKDLPTLK